MPAVSEPLTRLGGPLRRTVLHLGTGASLSVLLAWLLNGNWLPGAIDPASPAAVTFQLGPFSHSQPWVKKFRDQGGTQELWWEGRGGVKNGRLQLHIYPIAIDEGGPSVGRAVATFPRNLRVQSFLQHWEGPPEGVYARSPRERHWPPIEPTPPENKLYNLCEANISGDVVAVGIPFLCLTSEHWFAEYDRTADGSSGAVSLRRMPRFVDRLTGGFLPINVLWDGMVANTVFWGLVSGGVTYGARRLVCWNRARRGRCVWCSYADVPTGLQCPECGNGSSSAKMGCRLVAHAHAGQ